MNLSAATLSETLVRTTLALSVSALLVALMLRALPVASIRLQRLAWLAVLLQGCLFVQVPLSVPWYEGAPSTSQAAPRLNPSSESAPEPENPDSSRRLGVDTTHSKGTEPVASDAGARHIGAWLVGVWAAGIVGVLLWSLCSYLLFIRALPAPREISSEWAREFEGLLADEGIAGRLRLRVTRGLGPILCRLPSGYEILAPERLWRDFGQAQREAVLRHEVAHYRRGDLGKSLAVRLLALVHWFNPLAWWAVRRFDECAEWACDQAAAGKSLGLAVEYSKVLLALGAVPPRALLLAHVARRGSVSSRIRRLLAGPSARDAIAKRLLLLLLPILLLGMQVVRVELIARELSQNSNPPDPVAEPAAELPAQPAVAPIALNAPEDRHVALVNQAVQGGIAFLSGKQRDDGSWSGERGDAYVCGITSACTLALVRGGVKPDDLRIHRAADFLRKQDPELTYELALHTLALCAVDPAQNKVKIARNASRLEESQLKEGPNAGSWSYGARRQFAGDRSNADFAVWALDAAARSGARVRVETWERALNHWLTCQNADGGWAYSGPAAGAGATGSMTAAGVATVSICLERVRTDENPPTDAEKQSIERGLNWLAKNFSVQRNPGGGQWLLYYAVMLRRAGDATQTKTLGDHDWQREFAGYFLEIKNAQNGSWRGDGMMENDPTLGTAFVLLALVGVDTNWSSR